MLQQRTRDKYEITCGSRGWVFVPKIKKQTTRSADKDDIILIQTRQMIDCALMKQELFLMNPKEPAPVIHLEYLASIAQMVQMVEKTDNPQAAC